MICADMCVVRYVCALIYVRDIVINSVTGRDKRFFGCTVILEISMYGRTRKTKIYHRIRGGKFTDTGGHPQFILNCHIFILPLS